MLSYCRRILLVLSLGALAAAILPACRRPAPAPPAPDFLARVGDELLTEETFRREAEIRRVPNEAAARRALLDTLVRELRLVHLARQRGFDRDPEMLRQVRALLIARAHAELNGGDNERDAAIPDAEVAAYYQAHPDEFKVPARVRVAHLFVATPPGLTAEDLAARRRKIDEALAAAQAQPGAPNAHFGALALQYSEDPLTRYGGGDLGYQVAGMTDPTWDKTLVDTIFALEAPGALSPVIATPAGFHVVKLMERNPPGLQPLTAARNKIRTRVTADHRRERERSIEATLAAVPAEIRAERLPAAPAGTPAPPAAPPRLPDRNR